MADTLQLTLPALWLGIIVGLSFIETPLKFRVPGMTLPVALELGRRVFTAANVVGGAILIALTVVTASSQPSSPHVTILMALWVVLVFEVGVLRPILAVRTNSVIAGEKPRRSRAHLLYVVAELLLVILLVLFIAVAR